MNTKREVGRRSFLKGVVTFTMAEAAFLPRAGAARSVVEEEPNIIGPRQGFSPQIGTLVSMLNWMRGVILASVQGLTTAELDHLVEPQANSIGALLLHLAATERYYQIHTFEGRAWGDWDEEISRRWGAASALGEEARRGLKGKHLSTYLDALSEMRAHTIEELRNRDDAWLMQVDRTWEWGPTNNYCKWFHVCEHESNHNGQIKWIRRRLLAAAKRR